MATRSQNPKIFYGWWIVVLLFFTLINTAGAGFYSFSVYVPRLTEAFSCSTSSLMLTGALWSIVFGFSNPWIGAMMQKHGVKKIFIAGVMAGGFLMLLMSFMWHFIVAHDCLLFMPPKYPFFDSIAELPRFEY